MKLTKMIAIIIFSISSFVYVVSKTSTYSTNYKIYNLEEQVTELSNKNDELQIQLTTNLSRTELMKKYPKLELFDNIYYIEEENEK